MQCLALGDRMKDYEHVSRVTLTRRMPLIIRVDGKAFHSWTKGLDRPFDSRLSQAMANTAQRLVAGIQGAKLAYTQSDEISILITDYEKLTTEAWFGKILQKVVSVSASMATAEFNACVADLHRPSALFDSRAFVLPKEEVCNYFIWRQQDATRNSIQMLGQAYFSSEQLHEKNNNNIQDMLIENGFNWNNLPTRHKRGICATSKEIDYEIPIFTQDRDYVERYVRGPEAQTSDPHEAV